MNDRKSYKWGEHCIKAERMYWAKCVCWLKNDKKRRKYISLDLLFHLWVFAQLICIRTSFNECLRASKFHLYSSHSDRGTTKSNRHGPSLRERELKSSERQKILPKCRWMKLLRLLHKYWMGRIFVNYQTSQRLSNLLLQWIYLALITPNGRLRMNESVRTDKDHG